MQSDIRKAIKALQQEGTYSFPRIIDYIKKENIKLGKEQLLRLISEDPITAPVYTPNSIAGFMARVGKLFSPQTILDPACGTGNLLYYCDYGKEIHGYDINQDIISVAEYLTTGVEYKCTDFLAEPIERKYNLIVSHFPFGGMLKQAGVPGHYEKAFLAKCLNLVEANGSIICVVPNNLLYAPYTDELRRQILGQYSLEMIVNLPRDTFPHTLIETSILLIRNASQKKSVYLAVYGNNPDEIIRNYQKQEGEIWINAERLLYRWDRHFYDPKFREIEEQLKGSEYKSLREMADIKRGFPFRREQRKQQGKYLILSIRNIENNTVVFTERDQYADEIDDPRFGDAIVQEGDIVVNLLSTQRKLYIRKEGDPPSVINHNYAIIRARENQYINTYLTSETGQKLFSQQAERKARGATVSHITIGDLGRIRIPILPLTELNILSEENLVKLPISELQYLMEEISSSMYPPEHESMCYPESPVVKEEISPYLPPGREEILPGLLPATGGILGEMLTEFASEIIDRLVRIERKVDQILAVMEVLQNDIANIRLTERSVEEKIEIIYAKIETKLDTLKERLQDDIKIYIGLMKRTIENWDRLDTLSKEILPLAEYLFDKLVEINDADYSPVILQYCKCLENEMLRKLFAEFTISLNQAYEDINSFLEQDLQNLKTERFAKYIRRYRGESQEEIKYTLGEMQRILRLTSGKKTIQQSPLLQAFRTFILKHFEEAAILSAEYLNRVDSIVNEFRNRCAHPYKMTQNDALNCKTELPKDIDYFIGSWIQ